MLVGVTDVATAALPLKRTVDPPCAIVAKFVPVIVTTVPTVPVAGVNPVMVGGRSVTVSAKVPGVRIGAVAVSVTGPAITPVTTNWAAV